MVTKSLPEIVRVCHNLFFDILSKPQRENLGRSSAALTQAGSGRLSAVARSFVGAHNFRYRLKRLDRFIGNQLLFIVFLTALILLLLGQRAQSSPHLVQSVITCVADAAWATGAGAAAPEARLLLSETGMKNWGKVRWAGGLPLLIYGVSLAK